MVLASFEQIVCCYNKPVAYMDGTYVAFVIVYGGFALMMVWALIIMPLCECCSSDQQEKHKPVKCVYFIGALGRINIGGTDDLNKRFRSLQDGCPTKMELVRCIKTDHPTELASKIHKIFEKKRVIGDWFNVCPDELDYIGA